MNKQKLSMIFLRYHKACPEGIKFVVRNKLLNIPFDVIKKIKGNYNHYVSWVWAQYPISDCFLGKNLTCLTYESLGTKCFSIYDPDGNFIRKW
jgi:hypothetical protein